MPASIFISSLPSHQTSSLPDAFTFAVLGSKTYTYRNELKSLGGRFTKTVGNFGPGWLFVERKRSDVQHFVNRVNTFEQEDVAETSSQGTSKTGNTDRSIRTDKEYEQAVMVEDLIQKTLITTIVSKVQNDDVTTYKLLDNMKVDVKFGDVCVAEWTDGRVAIVRQGVVQDEKIKILPFLGAVNINENQRRIMEYFICFLTLTMSPTPVYYTDGCFSYAFCDRKNFNSTITLFELEL